VDPDVIFGHAKLRTYTPGEAGQFLAALPAFWPDHFLVMLGTGLRAGELLGLRARRVDLPRRRLEVIDVRYDAGRFGSGYKNRPKSDTSLRIIPLAGPVMDALARRLKGCPADGLVFSGPGGGNGIKAGSRTTLSIGNLRRAYKRAAARAELHHLNLRGPHDLRHTFATWLEDGGIPSRVIHELMGHSGGAHRERESSRIGVRYRHTTDEMHQRVVAALDERLGVVLAHVDCQDSVPARRCGPGSCPTG
jgi:integrase